MPASTRSSKNLKFTPLATTSPGIPTAAPTGLNGAATGLVTATKLISPHVTVKTALVILLAALFIILLAILTTVLIITNMKSGDSQASSLNISETTQSELITTPASSNISTPSSANISTPSSAKITTPSSANTSTPSSSNTSTPSSANISTPSSAKITTPSSASISTPSSSTISTQTIVSSSSSSSSPSPTSSSSSSGTSASTAASTTFTSQTSTTTAPYISSCKSSEFMCTNGNCIPHSRYCDGFPDCTDGTDEGVQCNCTKEQFQCSNGQCIPITSVCNEIIDCLNKDDEANCPDCRGFRCKSDNVCLWDKMKRQCDGTFDCEDYSDEMNCSRGSGYTRCKNGVSVRSTLWCDGLDDCGDNTDEESCVCGDRQISCSKPTGKCIPSTWMCDGISDCETGADEVLCANCSVDQFQCKDFTCVSKSKYCDGKPDCNYMGGDEDGCVKIDTDYELAVTIGGAKLQVCRDGWTKQHSSNICTSLYKRLISSWPSKASSGMPFAVLKNFEWNIRDAITDSFEVSDACLSGEIINVKCDDQVECGQRKTDFLESFVAGGGMSPLGKWPWIVSLSYLNSPTCGGVLIGSRWVLTAAHCIKTPVPNMDYYDFQKTPFYFTITAGSIQRQTDPMASFVHRPQVVRVAEIFYHPKVTVLEMSGGLDWDLALLRLENDITYTEVVQPLCLPPPDYVFMPSSYCYLAGWGLVSFRQRFGPQKLRDTRMQILSEDSCSKNKVVGETSVNINSTICAGFRSGRPTGCQGDSGSPLMCLDSVTRQFTLAGVMSKGSHLCGEVQPKGTLRNRFARISTSVQWIQETMRKKDIQSL